MTKWRRSLTFRREYYRVLPLGDGWKVRMDFWITEYKENQSAEVDMSLIAYRGFYLYRWTWRKEGRIVGPGGLAVSSAALQLLREIEQVAPHKTRYRDLWVYVTGARLNLYLMYRSVLKPRGYTETWEFPGEYGPAMIKQIG